jgi:hypothetical protein
MRLIVLLPCLALTACGKPDSSSNSHRPDDSSAVFAGAVQDANVAYAAAGATESETTVLTTALELARAELERDPGTELSAYARSGRALHATSLAAGLATLASLPAPVLAVLRPEIRTQSALAAAAEEALKLEDSATSLRKALDAALAYAASVPSDDAAIVQAYVASVWDALAVWTAERMSLALQRNGDALARLLAAEPLDAAAVRELLSGQQMAAATLSAYARDFIAAQTGRLDATRAFDSTVDGGLAKLLGGYAEDAAAVVSESEQARATRAYLAEVAPAQPPSARTEPETRSVPADAYARFPLLIARRLDELAGAQVATAIDLARSHRSGRPPSELAVEPEAALRVARARVAVLTSGTEATSLQAPACYGELSEFDPRGVEVESTYVAAMGREAAAVCALASERGLCGARLTEILCDELASCRDRLIALTQAADVIAEKDLRDGVLLMATAQAQRVGCRELPLESVLGTLR